MGRKPTAVLVKIAEKATGARAEIGGSSVTELAVDRVIGGRKTGASDRPCCLCDAFKYFGQTMFTPN